MNACTVDSFVKNNVLIDNSGGSTLSGNATVSDNTAAGAASSVFLDPAAGDFHLFTPAANSAAGTVGIDIAASDFDGTARPQGATSDRGAYEG